jgi:hypothetical protein
MLFVAYRDKMETKMKLSARAKEIGVGYYKRLDLSQVPVAGLAISSFISSFPKQVD